MLVTIERVAPGQVVALVGEDRFEAEYDRAYHKWRVETGRGIQFSNSAKLHSLVKLLGGEREYRLAKRERDPIFVLPPLDAAMARQVRRLRDSMQEFRFVPGRQWKVLRSDGYDEGYTPRRGGDPVFHTITQAAGVYATRQQVEEALAAMADGRQPALPPRLAPLLPAVSAIAEALAQGKRRVKYEDITYDIGGPLLPPNWDSIV